MRIKQSAFTIVELLIVIVVIGILAAITLVAYNGLQKRANSASLQSDLTGASKILRMDQITSSSYPTTLAAANGGKGLSQSPGTTYEYYFDNTANPQTFCITATKGTIKYRVNQTGNPVEGNCNLALNATSPDALITDGNTASYPYYGVLAGLQSVTVNLGSVQDITSVKIWHFHADSRTYYATKTETSENNITWTTVFDSAVSGTYAESAAGRTYAFPTRKAQYIRDWINGSTQNTGNHWVEIQAL